MSSGTSREYEYIQEFLSEITSVLQPIVERDGPPPACLGPLIRTIEAIRNDISEEMESDPDFPADEEE